MNKYKTSLTNEISEREIKHNHLANELAKEGIVLLKNDNTLPFNNTSKLALYGAGAIFTVKGGTGSGEVRERHSVSIYEGLVNHGFEITSLNWLMDYENLFEDKYQQYRKSKKVTLINLYKIMELLTEDFIYPSGRTITSEDVLNSQTEYCVYVISRQAGEGADRRLIEGDYYLSKEEINHIRTCATYYKHFVLVINSGSQIDLSPLDDIPNIGAILYYVQAGQSGGDALASIIKGITCPSGKLAVTWINKYEDIPFGYEYPAKKDSYYKEGIFVGYRYYSSFDIPVRYPFGYGLSYTKFERKLHSYKIDNSVINFSIKTTNFGPVSGKDVIQVYVACPNGRINKAKLSLVDFEKSKNLEPNESQIIDIYFDMTSLASFDMTQNAYILERGKYVFKVGENVNDLGNFFVVNLVEEIIVSKHQKLCPVKEQFDVLYHDKYADEIVTEEVPSIELNISWDVINYDYQDKEKYDDQDINDLLSKFKNKDLVNIVVGDGMYFNKPYFTAPGMVGMTTSKYVDKGLINLTMSDGPAGLRLSKICVLNKKGDMKAGDVPLEFLNSLPNFMKYFIIENPKKGKIHYQFATAFPVESMLAQTWNKELLYQMGKAIAVEMEEFGITHFLAPAVNIQKNPLCGRNFEYYSEDPIISGKLASQLIRGIEEKGDKFAVIKHFACNSQETDRQHNNSIVDNQALREIYLKAFEIAVKEGNVSSIMTSYNLLNGIYTPNNHDLNTKICRFEWDFEGILMTDWYSTGKGKGSDVYCIPSGNDLIMPGSAIGQKRRLLRAIKKGQIKKEDLYKSAYRIIKQIKNSFLQKEFIK